MILPVLHTYAIVCLSAAIACLPGCEDATKSNRNLQDIICYTEATRRTKQAGQHVINYSIYLQVLKPDHHCSVTCLTTARVAYGITLSWSVWSEFRL
jgi:hypothetical protein